MIPTKIQGKED